MYVFDEYEILERPALPAEYLTAEQTADDEMEDIQLAILRNTTPDKYNATCALLDRFEQAILRRSPWCKP